MTKAQLLEIEHEMQQVEELENLAVVTDLPNAPPKEYRLREITNHNDVPAVDVVVDIDVDIDVDAIAVIDVDIDIDVDVDTPHIDSPDTAQSR
jgi:hypothetical protein